MQNYEVFTIFSACMVILLKILKTKKKNSRK